MASRIAFFKDNTVNINLAFTDVDLSGATVYFTVKVFEDSSEDDSTALIKKDITSHTDPTAGLTTITLTPSETNKTPKLYKYDIKLKKANGDKQTVAKGKCEIKQVITNRG